MHKFILLLTGIFFSFAVDAQLAKAEWMLGSWQQQSARGTMVEVWKRSSDSSFVGRSYMLKGKDTIELEAMRLVQRGNMLCFIATDTNQNDGLPVTFTSITIDDDQVIFENEAHDFPQKISYKRAGTDSLKAQISGTIDGQTKARDFPMRRIP